MPIDACNHKRSFKQACSCQKIRMLCNNSPCCSALPRASGALTRTPTLTLYHGSTKRGCNFNTHAHTWGAMRSLSPLTLIALQEIAQRLPKAETIASAQGQAGIVLSQGAQMQPAVRSSCC